MAPRGEDGERHVDWQCDDPITWRHCFKYFTKVEMITLGVNIGRLDPARNCTAITAKKTEDEP